VARQSATNTNAYTATDAQLQAEFSVVVPTVWEYVGK
jgi:hypothetical protein